MPMRRPFTKLDSAAKARELLPQVKTKLSNYGLFPRAFLCTLTKGIQVALQAVPSVHLANGS